MHVIQGIATVLDPASGPPSLTALTIVSGILTRVKNAIGFVENDWLRVKQVYTAIFDAAPCRLVATALVSAAETKAEIASLEATAKSLSATAPHLADRIKLEKVCMQALPQILRGKATILETICPQGSLSLVEPLSRDPILSKPYADCVAQLVCTYCQASAQVVQLLMIE